MLRETRKQEGGGCVVDSYRDVWKLGSVGAIQGKKIMGGKKRKRACRWSLGEGRCSGKLPGARLEFIAHNYTTFL